ncbi:MAG: hypothetical protein ACT4O1_07750 [Gemmatimonadota bacterium]
MRIGFALTLLAAVTVPACDDQFGPQPWNATPDTIMLFSLSRSDLLGMPSAFDAVNHRRIEIETPGSTGAWDFALGGTNGELQLIPASGFAGQGGSRAAIATITGVDFDALLEAPDDTARFSSRPVTLTVGGVYVVRTRRVPCSFGSAVHYGKIKAVAVDPPSGRASFAVVVNPLCNDRSFVPPED